MPESIKHYNGQSYVKVFLSPYVGVTLQSLIFRNPGTGQLKTPDIGLENASCQNAWDSHLIPYWDTLRQWELRKVKLQEAVGSWSSFHPMEESDKKIDGSKMSAIKTIFFHVELYLYQTWLQLHY
jgi:hypothetical protein